MKVNVTVQDAQWQTIKAIAEKLGLHPEDLIQQSIDQDIAQMDVWLERAEILNH